MVCMSAPEPLLAEGCSRAHQSPGSYELASGEPEWWSGPESFRLGRRFSSLGRRGGIEAFGGRRRRDAVFSLSDHTCHWGRRKRRGLDDDRLVVDDSPDTPRCLLQSRP